MAKEGKEAKEAEEAKKEKKAKKAAKEAKKAKKAATETNDADACKICLDLAIETCFVFLESEFKVSAMRAGGCYLSFPPRRGLIYPACF